MRAHAPSASTRKGGPPPLRPGDHARVLNAIANFRCAIPGLNPNDPNALTPVEIIEDATLDNLAVSVRTRQNQYQIIYNGPVMAEFEAPSVLFWLQHECEHHLQGHTRDTRPLTQDQRAQEEDAADCQSIRALHGGRPQMINGAQLDEVIREVSILPGGGAYKEGPQRAAWVKRCADGGAG